MEQSYNLIHLLYVRKKINDELFDAQFNIKVRHYKNEGTKNNDLVIKLVELNQKIKQIEKNLDKICKRAKKFAEYIPLEDIVEKHCLSKDEKYILMTIFFFNNWSHGREPTGKDLICMLGHKPNQYVAHYRLIKNLLNKKLIEPVTHFYSLSDTIFDLNYRLTPETMQLFVGDNLYLSEKETEERSHRDTNRSQNAILMIREPIINFNQIILDESQRNDIEQAVYQIEKGNKLFTEWGFDQTIKYGKGMTMLCYGPPGTGKTATCEAIAQRLGKKIGIANYAKLLDMWFGNSEKNIVKAFEEAKKNDCVLVFDEADSLFAKRLNENHSTDRTYNYMTNLLMQEIERFDGLVILTTNREFAMDEAFGRRILFKIKFDIPAPEIRAKIWRALIPVNAPVADDVDFNELGKRFELTGGEIKNVIINVVRECGIGARDKISMEILVKYAQKETNNRLRDKSKNRLGFIA